jgi:hypothetical protein
LILSRSRLLLLAICSLLLVAAVEWMDFCRVGRMRFAIEMFSSRPGMAQAYFRIRRVYKEPDSQALTIQPGVWKKYVFPMTRSPIRSIRFDPTNTQATIRIRDARVENGEGVVLRHFSFDDFQPSNQIGRMHVEDGTLVIHTTERANDPILVLKNSSVKNGLTFRSYMAGRGWVCSLCAFPAFLLLVGLDCLASLFRRKGYAGSATTRIGTYVKTNQKKSVAMIGLLAAILSCYPVVFFGKSFVSPVGVAQLYPYPPYVPGFQADLTYENFRGSDVGATAWEIGPDTVAQRNALMHDREFPFWNRYVGGGVPLFAQGQSMIGDALHWVPILLGGNSYAWDIKFVLSKAIFAAGMGLLVLTLTGSFPAAALIAISSCFLGFFACRLNHPAFFVLTYAPWVVLQWDRLGRVLSMPKPGAGRCIAAGVLLAAATWLQLNAGAPKEGVITLCFMQVLGMLFFMDRVRKKSGWVTSFIIAVGFALAIIMVTAPYWLLFLDVLGKSYTLYDSPEAITYPLWKLLGFFDNFFFQQIAGSIGGPSTNIFVLLGLSAALAGFGRRKSIPFYATWLSFIAAACVAFGLVPESILTSMPFVRNIRHVWNTFSVPMMILALVLAGFGIDEYLASPQKRKYRVAVLSLSVFPALWIVYVPMVHSQSVILVFLAVFGITLLGAWQLYRLSEPGGRTRHAAAILLSCFFLLLVRHGMHLPTGTNVDRYVVNPMARADYSIKSSTVEHLKDRLTRQGPSRVIGENMVMFPGYNTRLGLESLVSVEPLRNKDYEDLLTLFDYPDQGWGWLRLIKSDEIAGRARGLDLLDVRYVLATPGTEMPQDMRLIHSSDLDVWERHTAWPRAFFVDRVAEVREPSDILRELARRPQGPFAAVEGRFIPTWMPGKAESVRRAIPAGNYALTNNSTGFSVDASSPGLIVLGETYYPGDFVVKVNGRPADYVRVNNAFKGIWVREPGRYDVIFTYRPARLSQAIIVCICGLLMLLVISVAYSRPAPSIR